MVGARARGERVDGASGEPLRSALRRAYFAGLSVDSSAIRFGVAPERLERHLREALRRRGRASVDAMALQIDDVALAAACIDVVPGAWSRLIERVEGSLVAEATAHEDETLAVITTRRFLIELRRCTQGDAGGALDLRRYAGGAPLSAWLGARMLTWRAGQARPRATRLRAAGSARRLRGAIRSLAIRRRAAVADPRRGEDGEG